MLTPRQLQIRGTPVRLDEVAGVYAVNTRDASAGATGSVDEGGVTTLDATGVAASVPGLRPASLQAMQDAGWRFIRFADPPSPERAVAKLFLMDGDRPVLATNRLVVGIKQSVSDSEAADLLGRHGARILQRITFAPGLYHIAVEARPQEDVLNTAAALLAEPDVEFAEPEFIEVIAGR